MLSSWKKQSDDDLRVGQVMKNRSRVRRLVLLPFLTDCCVILENPLHFVEVRFILSKVNEGT